MSVFNCSSVSKFSHDTKLSLFQIIVSHIMQLTTGWNFLPVLPREGRNGNCIVSQGKKREREMMMIMVMMIPFP